jgi:hypothetical protein
MARQHQLPRNPNRSFQQHSPARFIDPLTAAGVLLVLVAAVALITYAALVIPGAAGGGGWTARIIPRGGNLAVPAQPYP